MLINVNDYLCRNCHKGFYFDTSKEHSDICPNCGTKMQFCANFNMDPDAPKQNVPEMQPEQYFRYINSKPEIFCPYCNSTNTKKISTGSRLLSTGLFGFASKTIGKNFKCNSCGSTF